MLSATYEDGDTISYTYDSTGRLATVVDSATGRTTTYTYDFADRTAKYTETGANYSQGTRGRFSCPFALTKKQMKV